MNGHSWGELLAMGGYGLYVWGSVGVVLAAIALEVAELHWARRTLLRQLRALKELA